MRLLFASQPIRSHLHSLLPLALAARAAGHAVGIASGPRLEPFVRELGFDFLPCGIDVGRGDDALFRLPGQDALEGAPLVVRQLSGFASGLGPPFLRDLLDRGAAWEPDVVVREPVEFASALAAERWGIPYASVMWAIYIDPRYLVREVLSGVCEHFGLDPVATIDGFDRHFVVRYLPSSWQIADSPDPSCALAFRAEPFDRQPGEAAPAWLEALKKVPRESPLVWVTLGTSFAREIGLYRVVLDALAGMDARAIVTVGEELTPEALGPLPPNVLAAAYTPASLLLPRCDAVVFHGGFNTLHAALWHGLPVVVIPQEAGDQGPTARQAAELGLGVHVPGPVPPVADLRAAVERVLREPAPGRAARAMRSEMLALPPLEDAVARIGALAGVGTTSSPGHDPSP